MHANTIILDMAKIFFSDAEVVLNRCNNVTANVDYCNSHFEKHTLLEKCKVLSELHNAAITPLHGCI